MHTSSNKSPVTFSFVFRTTGPISIIHSTNIELHPFPRGDNNEIAKIHWRNFKKSSSPEPMGQLQPNLAQRILGWRGFNSIQTKGHVLFYGEIVKIYWRNLRIFPGTNWPISTKLGTNHPRVNGIQGDPSLFQRGRYPLPKFKSFYSRTDGPLF